MIKKNISITCAMLLSPVIADEISSSEEDQTALNVTIYNSNIALVKDQRELTLPTSVSTLAFKGVSARIQPETAILKADGVTLLEQNFEFDLLTPESLLNKFVGKTVTLESYEDKKLVQKEAKVLSNNQGTILQVGDQIITNRGISNIIFDNIPKDLRDHPTLTMKIDNKIPEKQGVELSYITDAMSWKADYVAALNNNKTLNLKGWVTLTNDSGTTYNNAKLQLVAGNVNRVHNEMNKSAEYSAMTVKSKLARAPSPNMQQESLFEYHLYTLEHPTTIKNKQQKQVSLLEAKDVPYQKKLSINAINPYGLEQWSSSEYKDLETTVTVTINNKKNAHLGMPMPAGIVRTYKKDTSGNTQFIGEDSIKHTPENETINLTLGKSFDITARYKQIDFSQKQEVKKNATSKTRQIRYTSAYEVEFKNAKDTEETVEYSDNFFGEWNVTEQSLTSKKINSQTNRWIVNIPAKGEVKLTYTVESLLAY